MRTGLNRRERYRHSGRRSISESAHGRSPVLVLAAAAALGGCGDDPGTGVAPDTDVASVEVTAPRDTLIAIGETVQLSATARNAAGDELPGIAFTWESSAPASITVADSGLATAAGSGSATVTAVAGAEAGATELYVVQAPVSVVISPDDWSASWVGARLQFTAEARDGNGHPVADAGPFSWISGNSTVATVDSQGIVTARAEGIAELLATLEAGDESTGGWCIVNHGLYHSRLTENGTLLAVGGHCQTDFTRWDDAWAGRMFSLKHAVEVYLDKTSACDRAAYEATIP
ncbi:MAG: Ig-like domain-containing protein [Candidatus Longimicrobiales bacterium M2_2A_002]